MSRAKLKKRAIILKIAPFFAFLLINILLFTCKKRYHGLDELSSERYIFSFWHGELLFGPILFRKLKRDRAIKILISEHFDGEVIAKIVSFFSMGTIRGSSSKGSKRLFLQALKSLKNGDDIGITPDGPRGPKYKVADGIVVLSKKSNTKIVATKIECSSYWSMNSWDSFMIPKPFSLVEFHIKRPFLVDSMEIEEAKSLVASKMT